MSRQLDAIYKNDQRIKDFKYGYRQALLAAAEFIDGWDGQKCKYRLADLLLMKFNQVSRKKPRLARRETE